jgi:hypothetical protein
LGYSTGEAINKMRPKDEAFHRARGSPNPLTPHKYNRFPAGKGTFLIHLTTNAQAGYNFMEADFLNKPSWFEPSFVCD